MSEPDAVERKPDAPDAGAREHPAPDAGAHPSEGAVVEVRGLRKVHPGVMALDDVSFRLRRGECRGLMGENGAGKSTLAKLLAGIHRPDAGEIFIDGVTRDFHSPREARAAGIGMVHQELAFCGNLSIAENLALGDLPRRGILIDRAAMRRRARELLARIGASLDVDLPMSELSVAQEQLVQIAAAVGTGARILLFDEPTSSLSEPEAFHLFELIDELLARGVTILYVSHRLPEVFRLCDRISVLRDGRLVTTVKSDDTTPEQLVQHMIGRPLAEYFPAHLADEPGDVLLSVRGLSSPPGVQDVSLEVRAGEIVALAGLVGSGRSDLARAIFGLQPRSGEVELAGERLPARDPRVAIAAGLGLVPEDRKRQGLVLDLSVLANGSLAMLGRLSRHGFLSRAAELDALGDTLRRLDVRAPSLDAPVGQLSGGNQQKVVLGKWLACGGRVLIVDEPTRGVDVGAKAAIHGLIDEVARAGVAVLLISSELPEVLHLATRIAVMREGRIVGELSRDQATQSAVMRLMAGVAA